jgi:YggT family protein
MYLLGNFIKAVATILDIGLSIYMWLVIIRALISWVNPDPYNPIVIFLYRATEPLMSKVRRHLPVGRMGGIDMSPIIVILVIIFLRILVVDSLMRFAMTML